MSPKARTQSSSNARMVTEHEVLSWRLWVGPGSLPNRIVARTGPTCQLASDAATDLRRLP